MEEGGISLACRSTETAHRGGFCFLAAAIYQLGHRNRLKSELVIQRQRPMLVCQLDRPHASVNPM